MVPSAACSEDGPDRDAWLTMIEEHPVPILMTELAKVP